MACAAPESSRSAARFLFMKNLMHTREFSPRYAIYDSMVRRRRITYMYSSAAKLFENRASTREVRDHLYFVPMKCLCSTKLIHKYQPIVDRISSRMPFAISFPLRERERQETCAPMAKIKNVKRIFIRNE